MKVKNIALVNLKGETLRQSSNPPGFPPNDNDPVILVSDVLANVALAPQQGMTPERAFERYKFGVSVVNAQVGDELDVPSTLVDELNRATAATQAILVAGQIHELLK
jgi:hypothetical protein